MTGEDWRARIAPVDENVRRAAFARLDDLTKPRGSLGRLETLAAQLCAIARRLPDRPYVAKAVVVAVADHGVAVEGVSAYPAEVTPQMVATIVRGRAAINALGRAVGADVVVADFGVRTPSPPAFALLDRRLGPGTQNLARGDALSPPQVVASLAAGADALAAVLARHPYDVVALGELGIGNTTAAAAVVAACTGAAAEAVTGRGTGIDDARLALKRRIVADAVRPLRDASWERVAQSVGGFEIVALAGAILEAAARRIPVVLDGFIVAAGALLAARIAPAALGYCIAAHRSQEPGHTVALAALGLEPLLALDLRLGEGSGAALALPLVEAASRVLIEMQTFAEAGVSEAG